MQRHRLVDGQMIAVSDSTIATFSMANLASPTPAAQVTIGTCVVQQLPGGYGGGWGGNPGGNGYGGYHGGGNDGSGGYGVPNDPGGYTGAGCTE